MTDHIKAIKDALLAGPTPGPWIAKYWESVDRDGALEGTGCQVVAVNGLEESGVFCGCSAEDDVMVIDVHYIAAVNPTAIRSLLSRLEEAESLLERIYRNPENVSFPETLLAKDLAAAMKEMSNG